MAARSCRELTTVADDEVVVHDGAEVRRYRRASAPDTEYDFEGFTLRTLPRPRASCSPFATVNDVHFGETECGILEGLDVGPVFRSRAGRGPYPEMMNRARSPRSGRRPDGGVVKGDLTAGAPPRSTPRSPRSTSRPSASDFSMCGGKSTYL